MAPLKILIIGTSIAGPPLASFLLLSKPDEPASFLPHITILERAPSLRKSGQNIDVRGVGNKILGTLGVLDEVKANTTDEKGVYFVDSNNTIWATVDVDSTGKTSTPTADIEILRGTFAEILVRNMREISDDVKTKGGHGVEEIWGDYVETLEQDKDKVTVKFAKSGEEREFDMVVGADGLHSSTRKLAWGSKSSTEQIKRLGMYGAFFSIPRAETDTLYRRWYHADGRRGIMTRPSDSDDKTTVLMFVINEDERLKTVAGRVNADAQKALVAEYFVDAGWEAKRIIEEMAKTDDFYYDMVGQVKLDHYSRGRVVLLGDAGYCASPISGMGTTLALTGAHNLAGCLKRNPDNLQAAFTQYEAKMRPVVEKAQKLAPGMPYLMNPETAWGVWILNALMWVFTSSGIIKLMFKLGAGPPARSVPLEEYGFQKWSKPTNLR